MGSSGNRSLNLLLLLKIYIVWGGVKDNLLYWDLKEEVHINSARSC